MVSVKFEEDVLILLASYYSLQSNKFSTEMFLLSLIGAKLTNNHFGLIMDDENPCHGCEDVARRTCVLCVGDPREWEGRICPRVYDSNEYPQGDDDGRS